MIWETRGFHALRRRSFPSSMCRFDIEMEIDPHSYMRSWKGESAGQAQLWQICIVFPSAIHKWRLLVHLIWSNLLTSFLLFALSFVRVPHSFRFNGSVTLILPVQFFIHRKCRKRHSKKFSFDWILWSMKNRPVGLHYCVCFSLDNF